MVRSVGGGALIRLLYLVSHPIQYQAPLLRRIADEPDIALRVVFERVDTVLGYYDEGFKTTVEWDVPLREGYDSAVLADIDLATEIAAADVVWVHGWHSRCLLRALSLSHMAGKPVLMRGENQDQAMPDGSGLRGWAKRRYLGWIFGRVSAFLAIGSANRNYYLARGIPERHIFSVPYAVDNAFFSRRAALSDPDALRAEFGIEAGRQIILFAGKFLPRKRPDLLVEAWQSLPKPRPALLMVGDGEMRPAIEAVRQQGMIFTGFRNQGDLPALYRMADVFVLPSEREPWGLAVNEAMACGTAVVVSDQVGSALDLVDDTVGAVFRAGDPAALAEALGRVLANSRQLGKNGAERIAGWDFEADVVGLREALTHVCR